MSKAILGETSQRSGGEHSGVSRALCTLVPFSTGIAELLIDVELVSGECVCVCVRARACVCVHVCFFFH